MKKKLLNFLFILLCFLSIRAQCQKYDRPKFEKKAIYLVYCTDILGNGRPISMYLAVENTDYLKSNTKVMNKDTFLCHLTRNAVLFDDPSLTLSKNLKFYNFKNDTQKNIFFSKLILKIKKLNASFSKDIKLKFNDKSQLIIQIARLYGEFWVIKRGIINDINDSFTITPYCYNVDYVYNIKDIITAHKTSTLSLP